jgi:arylsulfatase A-like enzyme
MVLEMDTAVGRVLDGFRNTTLYGNTVFVVSADNGGILPGGYNWPYRGVHSVRYCSCLCSPCRWLSYRR